MFQSPIGGISFIANLLIIALGVLLRPLKRTGNARRYIVTQDDVARFERGRIGLAISRTIAYGAPLLVFAVVLAMSLHMLYRLYTDERRISLAEALVHGARKGNEGIRSLAERESRASLASTEAPDRGGRSDPEPASTPSVLATTTSATGVASDTIPVFLLGRDARSLSAFLSANDIRTDFAYRVKIAEYFGITDYSGSAAQNEKLLGTLKGLTYGDLERMIGRTP